MRALPVVFILFITACPNGATTGTVSAADAATSQPADAGRRDAGPFDSGVIPLDPDGGLRCEPPDVLILLDRTGTMHRDLAGTTPPDTEEGRASTKLHQAITAIDALVRTPDLDQTLRLGLAYFPMDPGGDMACITLSQRLQETPWANPACQDGEVVVSPNLGTGAAIDSALDPATTRLCFSTPTGQGLVTAMQELQARAAPGREQYVMLVTDGADFYDSCPEPDPLVVLRQMDAAGIRTFIVGFGAQDTTTGGVNPPILNRMACAGRTARNFDTACTQVDGGYDAVNPEGDRLYIDAANASELQSGVQGVAALLCCACVIGG